MACFRPSKLPDRYLISIATLIVDREVRAVLLAKEIDAMNGRVLGHLGHDLAVDAVGIGIDRGYERQLKFPLLLTCQVEAGVVDDLI